MAVVPPLKLSIATNVKVSPGTVRAAKHAAVAAWKGLPASVRSKKLRARKPPFHVVLSFVGNSESRSLNRQYRKKDKPTDVLSFSRLDSPPFPGEREFGELILCVPVLLRQAKEYGVRPEDEVLRLTVHGVLHLFGYDHETSKADAKKMFALQEKILRKLG